MTKKQTQDGAAMQTNDYRETILKDVTLDRREACYTSESLLRGSDWRQRTLSKGSWVPQALRFLLSHVPMLNDEWCVPHKQSEEIDVLTRRPESDTSLIGSIHVLPNYTR
jgi:hypothetical protein